MKHHDNEEDGACHCSVLFPCQAWLDPDAACNCCDECRDECDREDP